MEDKMAAGGFGHARNYGCDGPFHRLTLKCWSASNRNGAKQKIKRRKQASKQTNEHRELANVPYRLQLSIKSPMMFTLVGGCCGTLADQ